MAKEKSRSTNIEHQKFAFEILGILVTGQDFLTTEEILDRYAQFYGKDAPLDEKTVKRAMDTCKSLFGKDFIESRRNKGYRIQTSQKENEWISAVLNRYIALVELQALDYVFEPLVHISGQKSLFHLILCKLAKDKNFPLLFSYTKYQEGISAKKCIQVYALVQRDTKFIILGKDKKDGIIKNFFLSQMDDLKLDFDSNLPPTPAFSVSGHFEKSLGNYKGNDSTKVEIIFSGEAEHFIHKEFFQKNAILERTESGFLLKLESYSQQEVFNLVSKFMDYAELVSPIEWREKYLQKLEKQLEKHKII